MGHALQIFVDFDGTVTLEDTTDLILERFAAPAWREVELAWVRGEIGSRACMTRQVALLQATPAVLDSFSANLPVDPGFVAFVGTCATRGLPVTVLSDGLDRVARQVLHGMGLDLPVISNQLVSIGGQNWRLHFPHSRDDCLATAGNCKCARLVGDMAGAAASTILIGDGRSDFCGATQADFVFAKGALLAHCQDHAIPHIGFQNFTDLAPAFIAWLGHRRTQGASAAGASEWSHPL